MIIIHYFDFSIHTAGKEKMSGFGEPPNSSHAFVVSLPYVNLFLRNEAFRRRCV